MPRARHLSPYLRQGARHDLTCECCSTGNDENHGVDVGLWRAIGAAALSGACMLAVIVYCVWTWVIPAIGRLAS